MKIKIERWFKNLKLRVFEWISYDPTPFVYQPVRVRKTVTPRRINPKP